MKEQAVASLTHLLLPTLQVRDPIPRQHTIVSWTDHWSGEDHQFRFFQPILVFSLHFSRSFWCLVWSAVSFSFFLMSAMVKKTSCNVLNSRFTICSSRGVGFSCLVSDSSFGAWVVEFSSAFLAEVQLGVHGFFCPGEVSRFREKLGLIP